MKERFSFVIVGHVDHGKSTLIGRLFYDTDSLPEDKIEDIKKQSEELGRDIEFAFIMDHLQEEREQGITIDTAQTFFMTEKREYVIIDAPGHKEFLKNMITGASQAEAAILMVDANEGVREQTKRHAYILGMLGLKQVIVAVNKMDLENHSQDKFNEIKSELSEFLSKLDITPQHWIPISAKDGDNVANKSEKMPWYTDVTILEALEGFKSSPLEEEKPLCFPIQDVYKIDDKRILVGRIEEGTVKAGQTIKFLPSGSETKVKSVEKFLEDTDTGKAGECVGITLEDPLFIERGEVATVQDTSMHSETEFKANLFWMSKEPLKVNEKYILKLATQEVECKVKEIPRKLNSSSLETIEGSSDSLENTEVGQVIITSKEPLVIDKFSNTPEIGRFVIVDGFDTSAGGIITE